MARKDRESYDMDSALGPLSVRIRHALDELIVPHEVVEVVRSLLYRAGPHPGETSDTRALIAGQEWHVAATNVAAGPDDVDASAGDEAV